MTELFRALGALGEPPRPELERVAASLELGALPLPAAHQELFGFQLPPYAAIYLGAAGMLGGEAADRVAGFWRALGQVPPPEPDHVTVLLGLYARLAELEAASEQETIRQRWALARAALLWEHLLSWLPLFLVKLEELAAVVSPFYARWAALLLSALQEEAGSLPPAASLPLALRSAPALEHPELEGANVLLATLLSPVRVGFIVTRADLARAAQALGLGYRVADRRLTLRALLEQDVPAVLGWLAGEAETWSAKQRPEIHGEERIARFWSTRAADAARWLGGLRTEALAAKAGGED